MDKFLRTWGDRANHASQYIHQGQMSLPSDQHNPMDVSLALSRRLVAGVKVKSVINIEAGLDMIALAMSISSEASSG